MAQKIYTEGVFKFLINLFASSKLRSEMETGLKQVEQDPDAKSNLEQIKQNSNDLRVQLKQFCIDFPDDVLCKPDGLKKYYDSNSFKATY